MKPRQYIVYELYDEYARSTQISLDEQGAFVLGDIRSLARPSKACSVDRMLELLIGSRRVDAQPMILCDRKSAIVIEQFISIARADWNQEISQSELFSSIQRAGLQMQSAGRARAALLLSLPEQQLTCVYSEIVALSVDGHRVVSPLGFRGRNIGVLMRQTFMPAALHQQLCAYLPRAKEFYGDELVIMERSALWASVVAARGDKSALVFDISTSETVIYEVTPETLTLRDTVTWGSRDIVKAIAAPFGLSASRAPAIVEICGEGRCSAAVTGAVRDAVAAELGVLHHTIEAHKERRKIPVYVHSAVALPSEKFLEVLGVSKSFRTPFFSLSHDIYPDLVVHYKKNLASGLGESRCESAITLVNHFYKQLSFIDHATTHY